MDRLRELSASDPYIWVRCWIVGGAVLAVVGANAWGGVQ